MEALSILDKENGILGELFPPGNMHYTGERRFAIMEKRPLIAKEGNTKFTFHDAEKFATELTKYLQN
jgi:uncharacterized protein YaiI (UPF0178 family)